MATPIIRPRTAWGARPPKEAFYNVAISERTAVMAHYSAGPSPLPGQVVPTLRGIQAYHQGAKGWKDIAYNHVIDPAGQIWEGRGWDAAGGHCTGMNTPYLGVCYLGDGDLTPAAQDAFAWYKREAERRAGHSLTGLGHRDGPNDGTRCPGDLIYRKVVLSGFAPATTTAPAPTKPPAKPPVKPAPAKPGAVLKLGSRGNAVARLQAGLMTVFPAYSGSIKASGGADGRFGPATEGVVREFQRRSGLVPDGIVGALTRAALAAHKITI